MKSAARFQRLRLTHGDVMKPMAVLLMLNIIVLTSWTVIDPITRQTSVILDDRFDRELETFSVCSSTHQVVFFAVLCVIDIGSLLFAVIEAFKARNISTDLQESSYIFTALSFILQVGFIGIPVIHIAKEVPDAYYFITAGIIFVTCASVLVLIFGPKVKALRKGVSVSISNDAGIRVTTESRQSELGEELQRLKGREAVTGIALAKLEETNHHLMQKLEAREKGMDLASIEHDPNDLNADTQTASGT